MEVQILKVILYCKTNTLFQIRSYKKALQNIITLCTLRCCGTIFCMFTNTFRQLFNEKEWLRLCKLFKNNFDNFVLPRFDQPLGFSVIIFTLLKAWTNNLIKNANNKDLAVLHFLLKNIWVVNAQFSV